MRDSIRIHSSIFDFQPQFLNLSLWLCFSSHTPFFDGLLWENLMVRNITIPFYNSTSIKLGWTLFYFIM